MCGLNRTLHWSPGRMAWAREHLHDHAWLMLEHGFDQADPVQALLQQQGYHSIVRHRDMAGHERVTTARM